MKKCLLSIVSLVCFCTSMAQIQISPFIDEDNCSSMPNGICEILNQKLSTIISQNGIQSQMGQSRFILTCNYLGKIIPALRQGRTQVFDFNMAKFKDELLPTIVKRITGILKFEKIEFDPEIVKPLCEAYFPSIRQIIATIQQYSQVYGKIDNGILSFKDVGDDLANMIVEKKKLAEIRNYVEQQGMSYTDFFKNLFDRLPTKTKNPAQVILLLAEYEFRCGTSSDPTLQMAACILELMGCV